MSEWRYERYRTAYLEMARRAKYRPAAPSDGFGGILLDDDELRDPDRLQDEAHEYAASFLRQDDAMEYPMGCPDGLGNRAFLYAIEAARCLCGGQARVAERLLKMAQEELVSEYELAD